jgi:phage shock protein PspC (stress-responsive transcriptional regulator)
MNQVKDLLEKSAFGVCTYLAGKIGVSTSSVRMFFIYLTFGTLGSPIFFYLILAFWLNLRKHFKKAQSFLWD